MLCQNFYAITVFLRTACQLACELLHCLQIPVSSGAYLRLIYSSSQQLAIASHFLISLSVPMKVTVNSTQKTFQVSTPNQFGRSVTILIFADASTTFGPARQPWPSSFWFSSWLYLVLSTFWQSVSHIFRIEANVDGGTAQALHENPSIRQAIIRDIE